MDFCRKYIFVILTIFGISILVFSAVIHEVSPVSGVVTTVSKESVAGDYKSYYFAGKHLLLGDDIYYSNRQSIKFEQELQQSFVYPPLMAAFFVPFGFVPFLNSYYFLTVFSISLFLLSVFLLSRMILYGSSFRMLAIVAFFSSPILALHFERGQTDIVILALVILSLVFLMQKKSVLTGALIGIAASLKVTPLIFLPYLFIKDRKAFWSSVVIITVVALSFPVGMWKEFFERLRDFSGGFSSGGLSNSLLGVIKYFVSDSGKIVYFSIVIVVITLSFLFIFIKNKKNDNAEKRELMLIEYGIISVFLMIVPPVSWVYNGVHSLILFAAYWSLRFNKSVNKWVYFFFDILVYLLISQPLMSPFLRDYPIYHIFSLRPIIYLCFVALFSYLIYKENIHGYIVRLKSSKYYSSTFLRFCAVGAGGTVSNLIVFYIVSHVLILNINIAAVSAFMFAVTQNYTLNHFWTFRVTSDSKPTIKNYSKYVFVNLFGLALNLLVLNALVSLGLNALVAQALGVVAGLSLNYVGSSLFVFAKKLKVIE